MNTPILLITFNRPSHTRKVLEAILKVNPSELYIFQDGAREGNALDVAKCAEVRQVVEKNVPASCNLHTYYSNVNLGCGPGPMNAINWFFDNVEQGIIIEDDCVPHAEFFEYASVLLEQYKYHNEIRAIGSINVDHRKYGDGSYFFSMMNHNLCAWATWVRAWKDFDYSLSNFSKNELVKKLKQYGCRLREREYWCDRLDEIHKDALGHSSWDMQFLMSIWRYNGKGILPNVNLSTNIGFDEEATHTVNSNNVIANVSTHSIMPILHPSSFKIQSSADRKFHKMYFDPISYGWNGFKRLPYRLNKRLKRLLHHEGSWLRK